MRSRRSSTRITRRSPGGTSRAVPCIASTAGSSHRSSTSPRSSRSNPRSNPKKRHPRGRILAQNPHLIDPTRSFAPTRFLELVGDKLAAVEVLFKRHLDSDVPFIHKAGAYISEGGGKRVRPAPLLLTARLLGHDGDEEVTYAAVVEFIHTATLI